MLEVGAAILSNASGRVLIARRKLHKAQGGYWEFPGGKLEPGETVEVCLQRELLEELNLSICDLQPFGSHEHDYGTVQIRLMACRARIAGDDAAEIRLTDHDAYHWATIRELSDYAMAPADLPFVRMLQSALGTAGSSESKLL